MLIKMYSNVCILSIIYKKNNFINTNFQCFWFLIEIIISISFLFSNNDFEKIIRDKVEQSINHLKTMTQSLNFPPSLWRTLSHPSSAVSELDPRRLQIKYLFNLTHYFLLALRFPPPPPSSFAIGDVNYPPSEDMTSSRKIIKGSTDG